MDVPWPLAEPGNEPLFVAQSQIRATTPGRTSNAQTIGTTLNSVMLSNAKHPSDSDFDLEVAESGIIQFDFPRIARMVMDSDPFDPNPFYRRLLR
jgi:hypothetical protein